MASLWHNLLGRARPVPVERRRADNDPPSVEPGSKRYLAVVARERPDLLARVNRLFLADGNVEAILDRRHGERRRAGARPVDERRRADRRREPPPATDLAVGLVVVAESTVTALPERLSRWLAEGRVALGALGGVMDDLAALERRCEALEAAVHRLQTENEALRARDAAAGRELAGLAEEIARPLGDIVHRLRAG